MKETWKLKKPGRVYDTFFDRIYVKSQRRRSISLRITLASIILVIFLAPTTVFAAEKPQTQEDWFLHFFSSESPSAQNTELTQNQYAVLNHGLTQFDQSVTQNGYTITLESGISDGFRALLKFRVDAPEEVVLKDGQYGLRSETNMQLPRSNEGDYGCSYPGSDTLEDENPNDNSIVLLEEYCFLPPENIEFSLIEGGPWSFRVNEILRYDDSANTTIAEGPWNFTMEFSDDPLVTDSVELLEKPIKRSAKCRLSDWEFDIKIKATSFQLRTLSATVCYSWPFSRLLNDVMINDPIYIILNDGSRIKATFRMSTKRNRCEECMYLFDRPISCEDVAYIEFPHI